MKREILVGLLAFVLIVGAIACSAKPGPITPPSSPTPTPAPKPQDTVDIDLSELDDISFAYLQFGEREEDYARLLNKNVRVTGEVGHIEAGEGDYARLLNKNVGYVQLSLPGGRISGIVVTWMDETRFPDLFRNLNPPGMRTKRLLNEGSIVTVEGKFVGVWQRSYSLIEPHKLILDGKEYISRRYQPR